MSDQLPDFEPSPVPFVPAPKKPRRKPAKKTAKVKAPSTRLAKRVPKKRRIRKVGKHPALAAPYHAAPAHAGGRFTTDVYKAIASVMELEPSSRGLVVAIVQGLSGHK